MQRLYTYEGTPIDLTDKTLTHSDYPADAKIVGDIFSSYISIPELYGAVGDGETDDTAAIQQALDNSGAIVFSPGKTYLITATLRVKKDTIIDLNGATLNCTDQHIFFNFVSTDVFTGYDGNGNITIKNGIIEGGCISFAHGENILLSNVHFRNCINDHILEVCACKNYVIDGCSFIGMSNRGSSVYEYINIDPCIRAGFPWLPEGSAFYDGSKNDGLTVRNTYFSVGEGDYIYGFNAMGVHGGGDVAGKHKNISFINNTVKGFTGCGFRANDMDGVFIAGNNIQVSGDGVRVGDVVSVNDITIIDNYLVPGSGYQMIALTSGNYTNLTKSGNVAKGTNN